MLGRIQGLVGYIIQGGTTVIQRGRGALLVRKHRVSPRTPSISGTQQSHHRLQDIQELEIGQIGMVGTVLLPIV